MKQLFLFSFLVVCISMYSQVTDTIEWRESYKLSWDDFKGTPDAEELKTKKAAATGATIFYNVKSNQNAIDCIVKVYFERQRSWVKNKNNRDYLLRHEQGHFDLYEVFARKLRKTLSEKTFNRKSLKRDFKKTVKKVLKKSNKQQKKYDKQTGHSLKESNQQKWTKKIADELKSLDQYKNSTIILSTK